MSGAINGELIPIGGGEAIPLVREHLTLGRREMCDVTLPFPNISGLHCEMSFRDGYWSIRDLNSTNGIKVNGVRMQQRPLKPGDDVTIGRRRYTIQYVISPQALSELEAMLAVDEDMFGKSLLERAGLSHMAGEGRRMSATDRVRRVGGARLDRDH